MDTVRYLRRVNLGNYEHEELEVTTVVREDQDRANVTEELKDFVLEALNLKGSAPKAKSEKSEAPKNKIEAKEEVKVLKEKPLPAKEVKKEEVVKEVVKEEVKAEVKAEAKTEAKASTKKETVIKVKPSKATAYDRTHDPHKALLGKFLDDEFKGWRGKETLPKAIEASKALNGSEFQDGEGNILETFKTEFRKLMA